jgi:hypothetical protein
MAAAFLRPNATLANLQGEEFRRYAVEPRNFPTCSPRMVRNHFPAIPLLRAYTHAHAHGCKKIAATFAP